MGHSIKITILWVMRKNDLLPFFHFIHLCAVVRYNVNFMHYGYIRILIKWRHCYYMSMWAAIFNLFFNLSKVYILLKNKKADNFSTFSWKRFIKIFSCLRKKATHVQFALQIIVFDVMKDEWGWTKLSVWLNDCALMEVVHIFCTLMYWRVYFNHSNKDHKTRLCVNVLLQSPATQNCNIYNVLLYLKTSSWCLH